MSKGDPVTILLVEDDEIDVEAIEMGFQELRIGNPVRKAKDGLEALDILRGTNGQDKITDPFIVLLDLNMPRMNGIEFLEVVRADDVLRTSIIFVLTTSDDDKDRLRAYEKNVAGYILKDNAGESFVEALKLLDHYWKIVEFPKV